MSRTRRKQFANTPQFLGDPYWKNWTYENLPNSNYFVTDIDSVIRTYSGCVYLIEIRKKNGKLKTHQQKTYGILGAALNSIQGVFYSNLPIQIGTTNAAGKVEYFGGVVNLTFQNTTFEDGKVYWQLNGGEREEISEYELIQRLSFCDNCERCYQNCNCPKECE